MCNESDRSATWEEIKILLIRKGMSVTELAQTLNCAQPSIYLAFSKGNRPGVMRKIQHFYDQHRTTP
jgi:hypothetical protein